MSKIGNILKGGVLAAFFALVMISPVFAACTAQQLSASHPNLSVDRPTADNTVKCPEGLTVMEGGKAVNHAVYGRDANACASLGAINTNPDGWCNETNLTLTVRQIINTVIYAVGIIAVVMVIIGGINYALSQGDPGKVKKAKDTILYGIVGLVISLLAFAIVSFVLGAING